MFILQNDFTKLQKESNEDHYKNCESDKFTDYHFKIAHTSLIIFYKVKLHATFNKSV